jgi:transcription elongation GreA/GreB family factor
MSPIGKALMGKKQGDTVYVHAPIGEVSYKILQVR